MGVPEHVVALVKEAQQRLLSSVLTKSAQYYYADPQTGNPYEYAAMYGDPYAGMVGGYPSEYAEYAGYAGYPLSPEEEEYYARLQQQQAIEAAYQAQLTGATLA